MIVKIMKSMWNCEQYEEGQIINSDNYTIKLYEQQVLISNNRTKCFMLIIEHPLDPFRVIIHT